MTNVITTSLKKQGKDYKLTENFRLGEVACHDGTDEVKYSPTTISWLQKVRNHFKKPVIINSGYRTAAYNKKVGGTSASQHVVGTACDIRVTEVDIKEVAKYLETIGAHGIIRYDDQNFIHVDARTGKYWATHDKSGFHTVSTFGGKAATAIPNPTLRKGSTGAGVKQLQALLNIKSDGIFGSKTESALKSWQKKNSLAADGIYGQKSQAKMVQLNK